MTRNIRQRPERAAELQRLAEIASKCYALRDATRSANAAPLTGTEYLVIAQLLERVALDGADIAADYWKPIRGRPITTDSRNLWLAIDWKLRRELGERGIGREIGERWGLPAANAVEDARKIERERRSEARATLESYRRHSRGSAYGLEKLARDVERMRAALAAAPRRGK
jgi:hypothetical protein